MSWHVHKFYGDNPKRDARYTIRYRAAHLEFLLECFYRHGAYWWYLNCDSPRIAGVRIGQAPFMKDIDACETAIEMIAQILDSKSQSILTAREHMRYEVTSQSKLFKPPDRVKPRLPFLKNPKWS